MKLILIALAFILSACATTMPPCPPGQTVKIEVPVPVPCLANGTLPPKPVLLTDAQLSELGAYEFVTALHLDRLKRQTYEDQLAAALTACD